MWFSKHLSGYMYIMYNIKFSGYFVNISYGLDLNVSVNTVAFSVNWCMLVIFDYGYICI